MSTQGLPGNNLAHVTGALALALVWVAGGCRTTEVLRDALAPAPGPQECPHYFAWPTDTGGPGPDTLRVIPSSGPITDVPEYHDCQRFIVGDARGGLSFDQVYAIYASIGLSRLDTVVDSMQALATPTDTPAVVAATIVSYGGKYDTLGIQPGFNCLYFSRAGGSWSGWLVPKGSADPYCDPLTAVNRVTNVKRLAVTAVAPQSPLTASDIPAVARWDWDEKEQEQYIGLRCGVAWCEVGDDTNASQPPFVGSPVFTDIAGVEGNSPSERARVTSIKGWQDAQLLAVRRADGQIIPSKVWAVLTPHPSLYRHRMDTYQGTWVHVATAYVSGKYNGRVLTLRPLSQNDIYLCMAPAGTTPTEACDMPDPGPDCGSSPANVASTRPTWWSKIEYRFLDSKVIEYHCVMRRTPADPNYGAIPGTARWRWLAADETTWTRCEHGCCENQ